MIKCRIALCPTPNDLHSQPVFLNKSFEGKSFPNDISTSCADHPAQSKIPTYPINH